MIKYTILACAALFTLSHCGDGVNSGAPKSKIVVVDSAKKKSMPAKPKGSGSSMDPNQVKKAKEIIASVGAKAIAGINAKKIFKANCASCHGFTGNLGVNGAKDLSKSSISLEEAVAQVYHGRGLMIPYKDILSADELVAVAKYSETLRK